MRLLSAKVNKSADLYRVHLWLCHKSIENREERDGCRDAANDGYLQSLYTACRAKRRGLLYRPSTGPAYHPTHSPSYGRCGAVFYKFFTSLYKLLQANTCHSQSLSLTAPQTHSGESTIGRDDECDVPIPVRALSRRHAILLVEEGEHFIMDLGSRNCTYRRGVSGHGLSRNHTLSMK